MIETDMDLDIREREHLIRTLPTILTVPNELLATPASEVPHGEPVNSLAYAMMKTMQKNNGIGLAAPQIGVLARVIVGLVKGHAVVMVNPRIIKMSSQVSTEHEGCLSVLGPETTLPDRKVPSRLPKQIEVTRPKQVVVECYTLGWEKKRVKARGLLGRMIQHEIDHLDGLTIDRFEHVQQVQPNPA